MFCKFCGGQYEGTPEVCPHCQKKLNGEKPLPSTPAPAVNPAPVVRPYVAPERLPIVTKNNVIEWLSSLLSVVIGGICFSWLLVHGFEFATGAQCLVVLLFLAIALFTSCYGIIKFIIALKADKKNHGSGLILGIVGFGLVIFSAIQIVLLFLGN